ncbi:amidase [Paenirhodobacter enshiensis]|uniref:amidase n=1 Tax=Paenirhodobacter enshiensis TaxID=1105367 RepID=UPI0035AEB636
MTDDATILSATELSAAIRARRLSCTEVMEAYLDRIGALNPQINAILYLRPRAELIAEARTADAELAAGRYRGWMHGMPHAVKDLAEVSGLPTSWGSRAWRDHRSHVDALHVARIRAAGAIFVGKTNTPEFGLGSHTTNALHGPTRNPWNLAKSAGGSSGGAGAALGARLVPVADGSDMMGSLRNPAAFNMVFGFRPSFGRVPGSGKGDVFLGQLGTAGPMGRTVADMARLLGTMAGYDPADPLSLPDEDLTLHETADFAGTRIAWFGDLGRYLPFEAGVLDTDAKALKVLASLGCEIDPVVPEFDMNALWQAWLVLRGFAATPALTPLYANPETRALLGPQAIWEVETAMGRSSAELHAASVLRTHWYRTLCRLFERYDFIALPATQVFPFDVGQPWPTEIAGRRMDTYHRWMEVVIGPTLAGLPVAALPAGFSASGLPTGIQLVGKPRADRHTLELAQAYEWAAGLPVAQAPA